MTAHPMSTLYRAGLMSIERAVEEQLRDSGATKKELERLARRPPNATPRA